MRLRRQSIVTTEPSNSCASDGSDRPADIYFANDMVGLLRDQQVSRRIEDHVVRPFEQRLGGGPAIAGISSHVGFPGNGRDDSRGSVAENSLTSGIRHK